MPRLAKIEVQPKGAVEAARALLSLDARLPMEVLDASREVGERAVPLFAQHALGGPGGSIGRGIGSRMAGGRVLVEAHARSVAGYDYVGVSRFGHRSAFIEPRADRQPASVIATRRLRATGGAAALRFVIGGRVFYRRRVRGFHPLVDWASLAIPQVEQVAREVMSRLGRRIMVREATA